MPKRISDLEKTISLLEQQKRQLQKDNAAALELVGTFYEELLTAFDHTDHRYKQTRQQPVRDLQSEFYRLCKKAGVSILLPHQKAAVAGNRYAALDHFIPPDQTPPDWRAIEAQAKADLENIQTDKDAIAFIEKYLSKELQPDYLKIYRSDRYEMNRTPRQAIDNLLSMPPL